MRILAAALALFVASILTSPGVLAQSAPPPYGPNISQEMASQVLAAAEREAEANGWAVAIAIVDGNGDLVAFTRMDGAVRITADVAVLKARTSATLRAPSRALEDAANAGQQFWHVIPDLIPREGGIPIIVDGELVGAIGVSGVQAFEDAQVATAGAAALAGQ